MKKALTLIGITGFIILLGAAGNQDYAAEVNVYRSIMEDVPLILVGLAMMFVGVFGSIGIAGDKYGC